MARTTVLELAKSVMASVGEDALDPISQDQFVEWAKYEIEDIWNTPGSDWWFTLGYEDLTVLADGSTVAMTVAVDKVTAVGTPASRTTLRRMLGNDPAEFGLDMSRTASTASRWWIDSVDNSTELITLGFWPAVTADFDVRVFYKLAYPALTGASSIPLPRKFDQVIRWGVLARYWEVPNPQQASQDIGKRMQRLQEIVQDERFNTLQAGSRHKLRGSASPHTYVTIPEVLG